MSGRLRTAAIALAAVGLAGLLAAVLLGMARPEAFFHAYLLAFVTWVAVPAGSITILCTYHLGGGRWGRGVLAPARAAIRTLPLLAIAFVPLAAGAHHLYRWARPAVVAASETLRFKARYLNLPFFVARGAVALLVWTIGGFLLRRWSREVEGQASPPAGRVARLQGLAGALLVFHAIVSGFTAIDWVGSLAEEWYSSVFGLQIFVGQALSAMAVASLAAGLAWPRRQAGDATLQGIRADVGSLLLTLVVLYAYLAFSNGYVIWIGNEPKSISWFEQRIHGGWRALAFSLMVVHFGIPFWALLFRRVKRNPASLLAVVLVICVARVLDQIWMVLPAGPHGAGTFVLGGALVVGLGGLWLASFLFSIARERAVVSS